MKWGEMGRDEAEWGWGREWMGKDGNLIRWKKE